MSESEASAQLVWLASYPKSGNTWLRMLLRSVSEGIDVAADINLLGNETIASNRELLQRATGFIASELTSADADALRPVAYRELAKQTQRPFFLKVHDRFNSDAISGDGFPSEVTRAVVYVVRNPLDVAPSFASHFGVSVDRAIQAMSDPDASLGGGQRANPDQFRQELGTWSQHVRSWTEQTVVPITIVRYEDLLADTEKELHRVLRSVRLATCNEAVAAAVSSCHFTRLYEAEAKQGFGGRRPIGERFFRLGRTGGWRDSLDETQASRIMADHFDVMRKMGYA